MSFSVRGWIDQVIKNELESAYKTYSSSGSTSLGYMGQGNILCTKESVEIHITRSRHVQIVEVNYIAPLLRPL